MVDSIINLMNEPYYEYEKMEHYFPYFQIT